MRFATAFAAAILTTPAAAGFITIDEFTNAAQSDGLGQRTTEGMVTFGEFGIELGSASALTGSPPSERSAIVYSFTPTPLIAAPILVVTARNNQTASAETGILRATVGGHAIDYTLPGGQRDFVPYSFNFTSLLGGTAAIDEVRIDWLRPDYATGARQLVIDSIAVHEAPEPSTLALIGLAAGGAWIAKRKAKRERKAWKKA